MLELNIANANTMRAVGTFVCSIWKKTSVCQRNQVENKKLVNNLKN